MTINKYELIIASQPNTGGVDQKKYEEFCRKYSKEENSKARKSIALASSNLLLINPFFGYLLLKQNLVEASIWLPTAAVDGKNLYFNTGFISELTIPEIQFLICHELLHLIYGHLSRFNYPNGLPRLPKLLNIANDFIVNADAASSLSVKQLEFEKPKACYTNNDYITFTSEEVYEDLLKKILEKMKEKDKEKTQEKNEENTQEKNEENNEENTQEKNEENFNETVEEMFPNGTFDEHLDLSGNSTETNEKTKENENGELESYGVPELAESDIAKRMNELKGDLLIAKSMVDELKYGGQIPEGVRRIISELKEPVFNWRHYVKKSILGVKKTKVSWTTPKRRSFDSNFILPSKQKEKKYVIHVALDTSGSITEDEIRDFLSEVYGAGRQLGNIDITIWSFDSEVHNPQTFTKQKIHKIKDYEVLGNGGTSFLANWEYMKSVKIVPDLFIMFTDGMYADSAGIAGYCPTLYVIHGNEERVDIPKSYGKTIPYKKDGKTKRTQ